MTVKLDPSLAIEEGTASGWLAEFNMLIGWALACAMSTAWPFSVAVAAVNATVPKLSRGTMLVPLPVCAAGASSIHSADDSLEA